MVLHWPLGIDSEAPLELLQVGLPVAGNQFEAPVGYVY
jgi:hypothetical protein